jgi:hypothetical protein
MVQSCGDWPGLALEGAPLKLRLGGGFCRGPHLQRNENARPLSLPCRPLRFDLHQPSPACGVATKAAPRRVFPTRRQLGPVMSYSPKAPPSEKIGRVAKLVPSAKADSVSSTYRHPALPRRAFTCRHFRGWDVGACPAFATRH